MLCKGCGLYCATMLQFVSSVVFVRWEIVCRRSSSTTQSSKDEAADGKLGAGSKKDTKSRHAEILHALGKSTTESDVTEGCRQFFRFCMQLLLLFFWGGRHGLLTLTVGVNCTNW